MTWAVGILTWNRAERCRETITRLVAGLTGDYRLLTLDNGSSPPFISPVGETVRHPTNLGAGGGMSKLAEHLLATGAPRILFLEDDWDLVRPLDLGDLEPILDDPTIGQIRLGVRPRLAPEAYWSYALDPIAAAKSLSQASNPFFEYGGGHKGAGEPAAGEYQIVRLLWSNNPWAATAETVRRFCLTGLDEIQMARPYLASGVYTASTTPGHFAHHGEIRERRGETGWQR